MVLGCLAFGQSAGADVASAIDKSDTAWLIVATALVLLMTPALAIFYGGLVKRKNVLNTMMLSFVAVEGARRNLRLNGLEAPVVQANVFEYLESGAEALGPYDWIVLDPPAIAKTREKRDSLKWAVWKLVYGALPLLRSGGSLVVCTCTYQLSIQETAEACRLAAGDRGCRLALDAVTLQGEDHPAVVSFPEGLYLKCLWLRKV